MIKKITDIMFECFPYDPDHFTCFVDATRIRIAAQRIAELYSGTFQPAQQIWKDWMMSHARTSGTSFEEWFKSRYIAELIQRTGDEPV